MQPKTTDASATLVEQPDSELRAAILDRLREFNTARAGAPDARPLCIEIRTEDNFAGGLWGVTVYGWLVIELLFLPEELRGQRLGARVVEQAEREARARGCIGAWLDTFSFQARGFYERIGYQVVGTIPDHPPGGARYFLMKRF